jgi:aminoglycoside phosphotransferase (APT) family kinase protein
MIAPWELPGYLVERGLLEPSAVVSPGITVCDASSRNANSIVQAGEASLFVKQATDEVGRRLLAREAACHCGLAPALEDLMPALVSWDPEQALLVLALLPGRDMHGESDSACRDVRLGELLGAGLSRLHRVRAAERQLPDTMGPVPGVLNIHQPGTSLVQEGSAAAVELVKVVQQDVALTVGLNALRQDLRITGPIHHDAKWDNVLVARTNGQTCRVALVDWELAGFGDAAWDVGSVLAGYLSAWLFSIPSYGQSWPERSIGLATRPLLPMRPAIQAFWNAYVRGVQGSSWWGSQEVTHRIVRYAAARLLQTAYEMSQLADDLAASAVLHLQVASNIFAQPRIAAESLFGLPLEGWTECETV